jgi:hypothetical protein
VKQKPARKVPKTPLRERPFSIGFTPRQRIQLRHWRLLHGEQLLKAMRELVEKTRTDEDQFAALPGLLAGLVRAFRPTERESDVIIEQLNQFGRHMDEHCNHGSLDKPPMSVESAIKAFAKKSGISKRKLERYWYGEPGYEIPAFKRLRASVAGVAEFVRHSRPRTPRK